MKVVKTKKGYKIIIQEEISYKVKTRKEADKFLYWYWYMTTWTPVYHRER